jgi:hypothetical protein
LLEIPRPGLIEGFSNSLQAAEQRSSGEDWAYYFEVVVTRSLMHGLDAIVLRQMELAGAAGELKNFRYYVDAALHIAGAGYKLADAEKKGLLEMCERFLTGQSLGGEGDKYDRERAEQACAQLKGHCAEARRTHIEGECINSLNDYRIINA